MKVSCNVIQDILPLYVENIVSEDSEQIIEEHLDSCEKCKKYLDEIKSPNTYVQNADEVPMKKLKSLLLRKKIQVIAISVFLSLVVATIIGANLVSPRYFSHSDNIVSLKESNDGIVYATFDDNVSGYGISSSLSDDKSGYAYHIVAWDSIWDGKIMKNDTKNIVLNPNGENVKAVYYYETNGSGEILLYGEQQNPCGVVIKQPNLGLLAGCAILMLLVCAIMLIAYRKNKSKATIITVVLLLPISYLLSHLMIKGFSVDSYSSSQYFWEILLFMLPIYCVLLLLIYFIKRHKPRDSKKDC